MTDVHPSQARPFATIAVFALVGPLVGEVVLIGSFALIMSSEGATSLPPWWSVFHPVVMLFALALGSIPALSTGVLTVISDRLSRSSGRRYVSATIFGALCTTGFVVLASAFRDGASLEQMTEAVPLALIGALAALVCAWLTRRWRYNRA